MAAGAEAALTSLALRSASELALTRRLQEAALPRVSECRSFDRRPEDEERHATQELARGGVIDLHPYYVHGVLCEVFSNCSFEGVSAARCAEDSARALQADRYGVPYARCEWSRERGCFVWPQLEIFYAANKGHRGRALGLRAVPGAGLFALPYLGVLFSRKRREEDAYVMQIPDDVRDEDRESFPRLIDADPFLYSALVPIAGADQSTRVGLFGLAIAGFVNEPCVHEQINLVPCTCSLDSVSERYSVPFHFTIRSPLGIDLHVPVFVFYGCTKQHTFDPSRELLTVYNVEDIKQRQTDQEYPTGLGEATHAIVRSHPLPRCRRP